MPFLWSQPTQILSTKAVDSIGKIKGMENEQSVAGLVAFRSEIKSTAISSRRLDWYFCYRRSAIACTYCHSSGKSQIESYIIPRKWRAVAQHRWQSDRPNSVENNAVRRMTNDGKYVWKSHWHVKQRLSDARYALCAPSISNHEHISFSTIFIQFSLSVFRCHLFRRRSISRRIADSE